MKDCHDVRKKARNHCIEGNRVCHPAFLWLCSTNAEADVGALYKTNLQIKSMNTNLEFIGESHIHHVPTLSDNPSKQNYVLFPINE